MGLGQLDRGPSILGEESAISGLRMPDPSHLQDMPHRHRGGRDDGLAEIILERLQHADGRHPGAAQKHGLRIGVVDATGEGIWALAQRSRVGLFGSISSIRKDSAGEAECSVG